MRKLLFPLLMLSLGLNVGLLYHQFAGERGAEPSAQRPPAPRGEGWRGGGRELDAERFVRHRVAILTEALDLDEEQRARVRETLEDLIPRIAERRRSMMETRRSMQEELAGSPLDAEEFRRRRARLNRAQAEIDSLVAEAMLAEVAVLTPDQRSRYLELTPFGDPPGPPPGKPRGRMRRGPP